MSHEISKVRGVAEMAYLVDGGVPWHGLGQALPAGQTIEQWIEAAGMAWRIRRAKVRYPVSRDDSDDATTWRTMDDREVLLRSDNGNALGIVSTGYKVLQPGAVLEFFRDLVDAAGFTLDTAGVLFGGKRFWAMATIGADATVADPKDKVKGKLLLSTACDGTMATEARFTTVRVVCNNTLGFARTGSAPAVKVTHRMQFDHDAVKRELGIERAEASFADTMATFRRLAETQITDQQLVSLTGELVAPGFAGMTPDEQRKEAKAKDFNIIGALAHGGARGGKMDGTTGTAWGWLNAVTEYVDHTARARSQDNRLSSAWFGPGAALKSRALEMVTELLTANGDAVTSYSTAPTGGVSLDDVLAATEAC